MSGSPPAIEAIDLVKKFGADVAVDGVSFAVPQGSVLGLLGPNGAGKTTTVRMMTTLTEPTSGTARVAGYDVREQPDMVRRSMGLTGQVATVDELLTGRENIRMIGGLYGIRRRELARVSDQLLEKFSIADAADRPVKSYSAACGRRSIWPSACWPGRRCCFSTSPPPVWIRAAAPICGTCCAGWSARARTTAHHRIPGGGKSMADTIVVMDKGQIIAEGTPLQLKLQAGSASLVVTVSRADDLPVAAALLRKAGAEVFVDTGARQLTCCRRRSRGHDAGRWLVARQRDRGRRHRVVAAQPRRRVPCR